MEQGRKLWTVTAGAMATEVGGATAKVTAGGASWSIGASWSWTVTAGAVATEVGGATAKTKAPIAQVTKSTMVVDLVVVAVVPLTPAPRCCC